MPLDLYGLADSISDDATLELGGQKVTGADLKAWAAQQRSTLTEREAALQVERQQRENLQKTYEQFQNSTSLLFREAARAAAEGGDGSGANGGAGAPLRGDPDWELYEKDPVFGPYTQKLQERMLKNLDESYFKPWIERQLSPIISRLESRASTAERGWIDERQRREYNELKEWPDKFGLDQARQYGAEHNLWMEGTARQDPQTGRWTGVVDLNRVHQSVMGPELQKRRDEQIRKEAEENTLKNLRQNYNVIPLPNRSMSGSPPVKPKGSTPEEIIGNSIAEAANDPDVQRNLGALAGWR